jgi:hypothetical protein
LHSKHEALSSDPNVAKNNKKKETKMIDIDNALDKALTSNKWLAAGGCPATSRSPSLIFDLVEIDTKPIVTTDGLFKVGHLAVQGGTVC